MAGKNGLELVMESCEVEVAKAIDGLVEVLSDLDDVRRRAGDVMVAEVTRSGPVTVVRWSDGVVTKTRCQDGDEYDAEKGLLYCLVKRAFPDWHEIMVENCWKESIDG